MNPAVTKLRTLLKAGMKEEFCIVAFTEILRGRLWYKDFDGEERELRTAMIYLFPTLDICDDDISDPDVAIETSPIEADHELSAIDKMELQENRSWSTDLGWEIKNRFKHGKLYREQPS